MKTMKTVLWVIVLNLIVFSSCAQNKKSNTNMKKDVKIEIKTTMGDMTAILYGATPYHQENFIKLIEENYFDGLLFHRVIEGFMVQGGDPNSKDAAAGKALGNGGPGYTIPAELTPTYFHKKGALSAARTGDQGNPMRRSSGSQFYVVTGKVYSDADLDGMETQMSMKFTTEQRKAYTTVGGTPFLDAQYTVFGEIIEGVDIAVAISKVSKDGNDRPKEDVKIISIEIIK